MKVPKLLLFVLAVTSLASCTKQETAPDKVASAFAKKFPNAKSIKWDKENETEWEAEFSLDGKSYSANFSSEGDWKETEYEIDKSEIPATINLTLDTAFANFEIEESEISETVNGTIYEFELEKEQTKMEVAISVDGKVLKKKTSKEED